MQAFQSEFLKATVPAAQAAQRKSGIPASVLLAQAIHTSAWGVTPQARQANNYFNIAAGAYAAEAFVVWSKRKPVKAELRYTRFATVAESFSSHAALLSVHPRWWPAMALCSDPFAFAVELQVCGYSASDPNYAARLIQFINEFDLTQYDLPPDSPARAQEAAA